MTISDGTSVCVGAIVSVKCRSLFCNGCDLNATRVKTLLTVSGLKGKKNRTAFEVGSGWVTALSDFSLSELHLNL